MSVTCDRLVGISGHSSFLHKTDRHDITEILLKVALNTYINPLFYFSYKMVITQNIILVRFKNDTVLGISTCIFILVCFKNDTVLGISTCIFQLLWVYCSYMRYICTKLSTFLNKCLILCKIENKSHIYNYTSIAFILFLMFDFSIYFMR